MKLPRIPTFSLAILLAAFFNTACDNPEQTGDAEEPAPRTATESASQKMEGETAAPIDQSGAFDPPADSRGNAPDAEPEPPEEVESILDVHMSEGKILITGHLRSKFQEKDLLEILGNNFPDHEVVSELDVGYHVKKVGGWGNRVARARVPLFKTTGDGGRFRFEGGTVTLEGSVSSKNDIMGVHRAVAYYMESNDVTNWDVKLEVAK